jgi:predicted RNA methylase
MKFVEFTTKICTQKGRIYSFHKTSTREFIVKTVEKWGWKTKVIDTVKFPLPKRFEKYHKKDVAFTEVDIFEFTRI